MNRTLILMRHAKSSWDDPLMADHDRPLNKRGREAARALGDWLRRKEWLPDEVLCSTSARTRETVARLNLEAPVRFSNALYHADASTLLDVLHRAVGDRVLVVGHNPGIAEFARALVRTPPSHERFDAYPTGATVVARFDLRQWTDLRWNIGQVADFVIPREL